MRIEDAQGGIEGGILLIKACRIISCASSL